MSSNQLAHGLFTLDELSNRMVVAISCNDPDVKTFEVDVGVYS